MGGKRGFTLVELMVVVALLSLLAGIALPKMTQLIRKAQDARTKGNLGVLRSALTIYYADTEGLFPSFPPPFGQPAGYGSILHDSLVPKYISRIPEATPSGGKHRASMDVYLVWNLSGNQDDEPTSGHGWTYDANPFNDLKPDGFKGLWGTIKVLCRHTDSKGVNWSEF